MPAQDRYRRFIEAYLASPNATNAAISAGFPTGSARQRGYELLKRPEIAAEIERRLADRAGKLRLSSDLVLDELTACATSNLYDFIRGGAVLRLANGEVAPISEEARRMWRAVKSVKITQTADGDIRTEISVHDKVAALHQLARHFNLFAPRLDEVEIDAGDAENPREEARLILHALATAMRRTKADSGAQPAPAPQATKH